MTECCGCCFDQAPQIIEQNIPYLHQMVSYIHYYIMLAAHTTYYLANTTTVELQKAQDITIMYTCSARQWSNNCSENILFVNCTL